MLRYISEAMMAMLGKKTSKMGLCLEVLQALCPSGAAVMRWIYIFIFVVKIVFIPFL